MQPLILPFINCLISPDADYLTSYIYLTSPDQHLISRFIHHLISPDTDLIHIYLIQPVTPQALTTWTRKGTRRCTLLCVTTTVTWWRRCCREGRITLSSTANRWRHFTWPPTLDMSTQSGSVSCTVAPFPPPFLTHMKNVSLCNQCYACRPIVRM